MDESLEKISSPEPELREPTVEDYLWPNDYLQPRQAHFVIEYIKDFNASAAAIRAGYSEKSSAQIGHNNLQNPKIRNAINTQLKARARRTLITADKILADMDSVAQRCMQAEPVMYFNKVEGEWKQLEDEDGNPVYQFDSAGANKALENLARNQKLLTDKTEIGNLDGTNLEPPIITEIFVDSKESAQKLLETNGE